MILTFSQERKGVTATFREESSGRCDQMVVRPNAKAAKTLTPQCDLSPIWNLWSQEFHDFSFPLGSPRRSLRTRGFNSRVRHHPCTIQSGPDSLPSDYDGAIRRRVAGAPARSRHSSLRSHAENKPPSSAIPLGMTSGCRPSASHACKLSFLTRRTPASPPPETPDANGCENAVRFSV